MLIRDLKFVTKEAPWCYTSAQADSCKSISKIVSGIIYINGVFFFNFSSLGKKITFRYTFLRGLLFQLLNIHH